MSQGTIDPSPPLPGAQAREGRPPLLDLRDHRADFPHSVHVTLGAIELETLADHHAGMAADMRRDGTDTADLMEARAAELRRWAARARAGR